MQPSTQPIHAVLFDYGLVLSGPPDAAAWSRMERMFDAQADAFHDAYWKFRHDYDRGALNAAGYWQAVADELHKPLDAAQLQQLLAADTTVWTQPNQAMIDWAAKLQHAGVKTGILSNIGDAMEAGVLAECPWMADFAHHTFSHRLGMAKPEAAIYRRAAEGLGVAPENILFIDDREDNIDAARRIGMQVVQYCDHESFLTAMRSDGFGWLLNPFTKT